MAEKITLSDGTEVYLVYGSISIVRDGDFEGETIPLTLWPELREAVEKLINQAGGNDG